MNKKPVIIWLAVLCVFSGAMVVWTATRLFQRNRQRDADTAAQSLVQAAIPAEALTAFTLVDQRGQPFSSRDMDGKVWVASFFFTSCPTACRMLNMQVAKLQQQFAEEDVHFVSITCDPKRDTPETMARYADLFSANPDKWHFLTGDLDYITRIGEDVMDVSVEKETHSSRLIVFDKQGTIQDRVSSKDPEEFERLKKMVYRLLQEPKDGAIEKSDGSDAAAVDDTVAL